MSLLDTLIAPLQPWANALFDLAKQAGVRPTVTSALRSYAQQDRLYKDFLAGRSKYPVAAPGTSAHEFGYAFDMVVATSTDQADLGAVWISWNGVYGGNRDPVHFEFPGFTSPTVQKAPSDHPTQTSPSSRSKLEALEDILIQLVPTPLRGILNIAGLANLIWTTAGGDENVLLYWLTHPAEFVDAFYEIVWGMIRTELGL